MAQLRKMGRETRIFKTVEEIFQLFEDDLNGSGAVSSSSTSAQPASSKPAAGTAMVALGESYDPLWVAQQKLQLKVGNLYHYSEQLWQLESMDSSKLVLKLATLFESEEMEMATEGCQHKLKLYKGQAPSILDAAEAASRMPSTVCQPEQQQAQVFLFLIRAAIKLEPKQLWDMVGLETVSKKLYTLRKLKAGELTLIPVTDSTSKVTQKLPAKGSKYGMLSLGDTEYFVLSPKSYKAATDTAPCVGTTAPYWHVDVSDSPNLTLQELQFQGSTIKALVNPKGIQKHQLLSMPNLVEGPLQIQPAKKKAKKA